MGDPKVLNQRFDNIKNSFLNPELESLKKSEPKVREEHYLNLGIFYGLIFGILGNLLVTLAYNLYIESASRTVKFIFLVITVILFAIVLYLIIRKSRFTSKYYNVKENLEYIIPKIEQFKKVLADTPSQGRRKN